MSLTLILIVGCAGNDADPTRPDPDPDPIAPDAGEPVARCEGLGAAPDEVEWSIESGGLTRTFRVHVPDSYDPTVPMPVVLNFHGYSSNASQQELLSGMLDEADAQGFIAVHPQGTGATPSWNAGVCCGEAIDNLVDDVQFVSDMLDALESSLCVDTERVFSTGMSNGGFMSHRLGCELSSRITAIAPVAGVMGMVSCEPGRPVPVMHFHGTLDSLVPYEGNAAAGMPSVETTVADWAARNGCADTTTEVYREADSHCEAFDDCPAGGDVVVCTVEGGGHTWPGGLPVPALGHTTSALSATAEMWKFFTRVD